MSSFIFIFIFSSFSVLQAKENITDGLLFNSIYDVPEGRNSATSLTIPSKDAIFYENNLTLDSKFILGGGSRESPHTHESNKTHESGVEQHDNEELGIAAHTSPYLKDYVGHHDSGWSEGQLHEEIMNFYLLVYLIKS